MQQCTKIQGGTSIVGTGFPRPNGLGDPTPTDSTSLYHLPIFPYPGGTCRPSEALRYLVYPMFYKHAAPLGLNAAMHQNSRWDIHRRGGVSPPNGLGDPTPTDSTSLYHLPIFPYPGGTCRPSEALRYLVYPMFYKHVAPLGLNAAMHQNSRWDIHRRGGVPPSNGLSDPTPRDSTSLYHLPIFPCPCGTCRPAGALRYLVYPMFYKHAAPLGLNTSLPRLPVFSLCASAMRLLRITHYVLFFSKQLILQQPALNRSIIQCKPFRRPQPN